MKILITGGAGFIGSHLASFCVKEGYKTYILDNLSTGKKSNLKDVWNKIAFIETDITNFASLKEAMQGCDIVFHLAALSSPSFSINNPLESHKVNVLATLQVFEAAYQLKVKRVVYASSAAVYGKQDKPSFEEDKTEPISPYGLQKLTMEKYAHFYKKYKNLETIGLRLFNVFGPKQEIKSQYSGVIAIFINHFLANKSPTIFGDGLQSRDFIYVDDVVQACWLAATNPQIEEMVLNIGTGNTTTVLSLFNMLCDISKKKLTYKQMKSRSFEIQHSVANITKAKKYLNYAPTTSIYDGLKKLWQFHSR